MKFFKYIHLCYLFVWGTLIFLLFLPFFYLFTLDKKLYFIANKLRTFWSWFFLLTIGVIPKIKGKDNIKKGKNYIFCMNHSSYLDIPISMLFMQKNYCFLGKKELTRNFFCWVFFRSIDIPVDRESKLDSMISLIRCKQRLKEKFSLIIFPEGTIPEENPPHLIPFKEGAFGISVRSQIPIVPITYKSNWKIMQNDGLKKGTRPGLVEIIIHPPIHPESQNSTELKRLQDTTFQSVQSGLY